MPIPNADSAHVPAAKISDYLLNQDHPVGGGKAKWFLSVGYMVAAPTVLEQDLLMFVRTAQGYTEKSSPFGTKYVVSGKMTAPNGNEVDLTTVWIVEPADARPRRVTAYPGEKE